MLKYLDKRGTAALLCTLTTHLPGHSPGSFYFPIRHFQFYRNKIKEQLLALLALALLGSATAAQAQSNVGIGTIAATPDVSAVLDLSSTTQGLLTLRLTASQRGLIGSPATGLLVHQANGTTGFYLYNCTT